MTTPKYLYFRVNTLNKGTTIELENASDVDVVEVVRCKDCSHYDGEWCFENRHYLKDYDFCSRAEKRVTE